jgi:hypothetical protein
MAQRNLFVGRVVHQTNAVQVSRSFKQRFSERTKLSIPAHLKLELAPGNTTGGVSQYIVL